MTAVTYQSINQTKKRNSHKINFFFENKKKTHMQKKKGIVVCFAQVPESVAFAFLTGVDPILGLHSAWIVGFITSLTGGRCAMISGATGFFFLFFFIFHFFFLLFFYFYFFAFVCEFCFVFTQPKNIK